MSFLHVLEPLGTVILINMAQNYVKHFFYDSSLSLPKMNTKNKGGIKVHEKLQYLIYSLPT